MCRDTLNNDSLFLIIRVHREDILFKSLYYDLVSIISDSYYIVFLIHVLDIFLIHIIFSKSSLYKFKPV